MTYEWHDLVGNIGVALILVAYLMLQLERIESRARLYSLANAVGALMILVSLCFKFNLSAFVVEFFWLLISVFGLVRSIRTARVLREERN